MIADKFDLLFILLFDFFFLSFLRYLFKKFFHKYLQSKLKPMDDVVHVLSCYLRELRFEFVDDDVIYDVIC